MTAEEFTGLYRQLGTVVLQQQATIEQLNQRVAQLEDQLKYQPRAVTSGSVESPHESA